MTTTTLSGTIPDLGVAMVVVVLSRTKVLQNGSPDGLALVDAARYRCSIPQL